MAQTDRERINELEQQVGALQARLAQLEAPPAKPARPAYREPEVRIIRPPQPIPANMATHQELTELLRMVRSEYAVFRPPASATADQERRYFLAFKGAFAWVISVGRMKEPNTRYGQEALVDRCEEYLRRLGGAIPSMAYGPLLAAAIACGDVSFEDPNAFPYCSIGVNPDVGHSYDGRYRAILAGTRSFLPPIPKPQQVVSRQAYIGETNIPSLVRRSWGV